MSESSSSLRAVELAWLEGAGGERRYVESETRIGRDEKNNVCLSDVSVSRDHALIRRADGTYVISDLGSANGTFVNEERIYVPRGLSPGDRVRLANVEFTFNVNLAEVTADVGSAVPLAASVSQFLTLSGEISMQSYVEGDLRVVTVLFLDICGFTALSASISPEQVTLIMNQCFQHLTRTAAHFGGYVDKYMGDSMMVLFGAPVAHGDDAERAVRAGIALQSVLAQFVERLRRRSGVALEMRIGINTGEVLAGRVGSGEFSAFTVMGDVVNVASRLEKGAQIGHVLVGESAQRLTCHAIEYAALPPMRLRGKEELITAYDAVRVRDREAWAEFDRGAPFVARELELRRLTELLDARGSVRTATIAGEVGIGKSRLLAEFRQRHLHDADWVLVRCLEYDHDTPFSTAQLLIQALQGAPDVEPEALTHVDLVKRIVALLERRAASRTVVCVLDGAEWADAESGAVLDEVRSLLDCVDVLLIATCRDLSGRARPSGADVIHLEPLAPADCELLIEQLLGAEDVVPEARAELARQSQGWPMFIEDVVAASRAGRADRVWSIASAYQVRSTVQAALDSLPDGEHQVLRLASVIGEPWDVELLADAGDPALPTEAILDNLVDLGYFVRGEYGAKPAFRFRTEAVHAVIDASLPEFERRRLHERVGRAMERQYDPARRDPIALRNIAEHFASAGQAWRAVEYLLRSADLAAASMDAHAAVKHYRAIIHDRPALHEPHERSRLEVEVHERVGDLLLRDGNLAEAQIEFELAAASCASKERRTELQIKLGVTKLRRGNPRAVLDVAESLAESDELPTVMRASVHALAALGLATLGDAQQALARAQRAVELSADADQPGVPGLAYFALGRAYLVAGSLGAAVEALRLSCKARAQSGERAAWVESQVMLGQALWVSGELEEAETEVRLALEAFGPKPEPSGDVVATSRRVRDSIERWSLARAALVLGRLVVDRGDDARGARHLNQALAAARQAGARELVLEVRLALARHELVAHEHRAATEERVSTESLQSAVDELRSVLEEAEALHLGVLACETRVALSMALCERARSEPASASDARDAIDQARTALVTSDEQGLRLVRAMAIEAIGCALIRLGHGPKGIAQLHNAAVAMEKLGARVDLARALLRAARAQYASGTHASVAAAGATLDRARKLIEEVGLDGERATASSLQAMLV